MKKITKEYREKSDKEIGAEIEKLRLEIAKTSLSGKSSPVKDTNLVYKMKKKLAVLLTIKSQNSGSI